MGSLQLDVVLKSPTTMTSWILSLSFFVLLYCGQGFSITYEVSNYAVNWFEAQQFCLGRGTTMVKINNSTEQSAARDWFNQVDSGGSGLYWIGLTDIAREGTYVWTDGMQASYFSWYSGVWKQKPTMDRFRLLQ